MKLRLPLSRLSHLLTFSRLTSLSQSRWRIGCLPGCPFFGMEMACLDKDTFVEASIELKCAGDVIIFSDDESDTILY